MKKKKKKKKREKSGGGSAARRGNEVNKGQHTAARSQKPEARRGAKSLTRPTPSHVRD